ncbi:hypothetical protein ZIOFF_003269 [Zingiber officinale]|uniref:Ribosomal protein eL8/eL30/eS12/Gadd45 domain-containing protein n=1 Tax=Zingiber officinale TaxID=94328 RepID=A0A8J5LWJ5_ZINOF|nr:hypothetical protein ZIOFF_003269 [Zingiber officinale]
MGSDSENGKSLKERKKLMSVSPIAKPLAGKKLCKRILKLVRRGILLDYFKLCVIAGNISPIDVITHVPILLEEADIPYIYVPSKEMEFQTARLTTEILLAPCSSTLGNSLPISPDLAVAGVTKRPTCCELVTTKPIKGELTQDVQEKLQADYNQVVAEVKELTASLF